MQSGFGFHQQLQNLNLFRFPFDTGDPNSFGNPYFVEDSPLKNVAPFPISGFHHRIPYFNHGFAPELNSASNEKLSIGPFDCGQLKSPAPAWKRFLVFDQSGDKTTMICTSGVETPARFWSPNPSAAHNLSKNPGDGIYPISPTLADKKLDGKISWDIMEDEMHEDTEELNALLCSDSDFSEDDEETSTGHSPSTMTDNNLHNLIEEPGEEVDSFSGPTKRRKLHDGCKTRVFSEYDAQLSWGNGNKQWKDESGSLSSGKRSRKEKIHETLSILQNIIPGAKGKVAIDVIDEAIRHLRSLKVKAKALGLDTL